MFVDETKTILLDLGVSAEQLALWERPAGQVLLETTEQLMRSGSVPVLRSSFLDQLIRLRGGSPQKSRERGEFLARPLELKAQIFTLHVGWLSPDKLETSIRLSIVEADSDTRHRRMVQGKGAMAEQGYWNGGQLPIGYRLKVTSVNGTGKQGARSVLEIYEEQAKLVKRIFEMRLSAYKMAVTLNAEGIPSPKGSRWRPVLITRILRSETYVGVLYWNKYSHARNPSTGRRVRRLKPKAEWVKADVPELRIIDDETWKQAQVGLSDGSLTQGLRNVATEYLLGKLLFYLTCRENGRGHRGKGCSFYGQKTAKKDGRYRCRSNVDRFSEKCPSPSFRISEVNRKVCAEAYRLLMNPDRILDAWQRQFGGRDEDALRAELERLEKLNMDLDKQQERADTAYVTGKLGEGRYSKQMTSHRGGKEAL